MEKKEVFEHCIRFVSELEHRESELDWAKQMNIDLNSINLSMLVIKKLKHAIDLVEPLESETHQATLLYYTALYANAIGKPRYGISWCYNVINEPITLDKYRDLAKQLLSEIKMKLPEDLYNEELQNITVDIQAALRDIREWLTKIERLESQPATKQVFNSDLIEKYQGKKARK
jgi:hypothetical protein